MVFRCRITRGLFLLASLLMLMAMTLFKFSKPKDSLRKIRVHKTMKNWVTLFLPPTLASETTPSSAPGVKSELPYGNSVQTSSSDKFASSVPVIQQFNSFKTNLKIFVYDLPSQFNADILTFHQKHEAKNVPKCMQLTENGMGPELYRESGISVRDTHQFSLEVIMHQKLLLSKSRTLNPEEADVFYIPAYIGLLCLCHHGGHFVNKTVDALFTFLKSHNYFNFNSIKYRPHFTTLGKIQREMGTQDCPYLQHKYTEHIRFLGIEKEENEWWQSMTIGKKVPYSVIPYPSYIHYIKDQVSKTSCPVQPSLNDRDVVVFLAASLRKSNPYRILLIKQFTKRTTLFYDVFKKANPSTNLSMVMLLTNECGGSHRNATVPWMQHSIFCLQPAGDSPTRKSFYDSVLSGCIPVLLPTPSSRNNPYPYQKYLDYAQFTITLPYSRVAGKASVFTILREIKRERIINLQYNLAKVSRWFQYSLPVGDNTEQDHDALQLIVKELNDNLIHGTK